MTNHSVNLTPIDKTLFNFLQNDFPVVQEPFQVLAAHLEISEDEVIKKIQYFKNVGLIRRIGPVLNAKALGYTSALFAMSVDENREEDAAAYVSGFAGVTHNYKRDHEYNLWFTLVARNLDEMDTIIRDIKKNITPKKFLKLPAKKMFKIKGVFNV